MIRAFASRRPFRWLIALLIAAIGASPWTSAAAAPAGWQATAGVDTADHAVQANGFFPGALSIHVGDSVTWTARSGEVHTVSFGVPASTDTNYLFAAQGTSAYDGGADFTSSGLIAGGAPGYTLTFTKAGDYQFQCFVHSTMHGTLHVLAASAPLPYSQAAYNQQATIQEQQLLAQGQLVRAQGLVAAVTSPDRPAVTAGVGQLNPTSSVATLRFQPDPIVARVGQTVVFTNRDPETPHTVTFNLDYPNPFLAAAPAGTDAAGHATIGSPTQQVNSGFLGAPPFGHATQFKVTFTKAGVYRYDCAIHDSLGMEGTVDVVPR